MHILTVNTGSSSVRLSLHSVDTGGLRTISEGHFTPDKDEPENLIKDFLNNKLDQIGAAGHRVVHGGDRFVDSCIIDSGTESEIERLAYLAPLHNPVALKWIRGCRKLLPSAPQVAVFDTAFYSDLPGTSRVYALPKDLYLKHGIRRYGFHGIAHRAMSERWRELNPGKGKGGRVISLQLGSGCSVTAVKDGIAVDTSMGFSPIEGLVMSTRSGDIDPGIIIYLQKTAGMSIEEIDALLNRSSGLSGVSGIGGDMKTLLMSDDPDARLAIDLYCYKAKKYIGAYTAALGGVDGILFGGGVGENSPVIRQKILDGMQWSGIEIDGAANGNTVATEGKISSGSSRVDVWVITIDEAEILAREALRVIT